MPNTADFIAFLNKYKSVDEATGCWRTKDITLTKGYAVVFFFGKRRRIHRVSAWVYFQSFDLDNSDVLILHKTNCPNKDCFNPDHLYCGTHKDNSNDMSVIGHARGWTNNTNKTHCKRGHEFNEQNTRHQGLRRRCKQCDKMRQKGEI